MQGPGETQSLVDSCEFSLPPQAAERFRGGPLGSSPEVLASIYSMDHHNRGYNLESRETPSAPCGDVEVRQSGFSVILRASARKCIERIRSGWPCTCLRRYGSRGRPGRRTTGLPRLVERGPSNAGRRHVPAVGAECCSAQGPLRKCPIGRDGGSIERRRLHCGLLFAEVAVHPHRQARSAAVSAGNVFLRGDCPEESASQD